MPSGEFSDGYAHDGRKMLDTMERLFIGGFRREKKSYTAAGALQAGRGVLISMVNASGMAMTLAAPTPGDDLILYNSGSAGSITVTLPSGVTWDGTNDVATFPAGSLLHVVADTATRYVIISNQGTVAFS